MLSGNWTQRFVILAVALALELATQPALFAQFGPGGGMGGGGAGAPPGPSQVKRYQPRRFAPTGPKKPIIAVRIKGVTSVSESRVRGKLQTREGRTYDPATVQSDVRELLTSGLCYDVKTYLEESTQGAIITFELFEQPRIRYVRFEGTKVRERTLLKKSELKVGQPLNRYRVEEGKRNLEEYYKSRGNSFVTVTVLEGISEGDQGIVYKLDEGPRQRIAWTKFEGNSIASDARLRTQIDSKPGILWLFKGKVDRDVISEDRDKLIAYYRSLGFFQATVNPKLAFDEEQEWLVLTFEINEGARYVIRSISVEGNEIFAGDDLLAGTSLRAGDYFDMPKMNADVALLKDSYGANGYIKSVVKAEPRFFEEPGQLDLVYRVDEGRQHRVGEIKVNIDGEYPHTRQAVVLNRINLREGDIIDIRKLRSSERRLTASQLFENGPMASPQINVLPRDSGIQTAASPYGDSRY